MAWTNLRTDYKDRSWSGSQKYVMTQNSDSSVSFVDITNYDNADDSFFSAADANAMNSAMNELATTHVRLTELWTNPSPTATYGGQTVNFNPSGYDYLIIVFGNYGLSSQGSLIMKNGTNNGAYLNNITRGYSGSANGYVIWTRQITIVAEGIKFENAYNGKGTFSSSMENSACIPQKILGLTLGV